MSNLYITDSDQLKLNSLIEVRPQAVMLVGYRGANMNKIVEHFITGFNSVYQSTIIKIEAETGKSNISIDAIRALGAKVRSAKTDKQVSIISIPSAGNLSLEAQTALLKILEEPTSGTIFILGINDQGEVLATIASRCYQLKLKKPEVRHLAKHLNLSTEVIKLKLMLTGGRADILDAMLQKVEAGSGQLSKSSKSSKLGKSKIKTGGSSDSESAINLNPSQVLSDAKTWATSKDAGLKISILNKYVDDRSQLIFFIQALGGVYKSLIEFNLSKQNSGIALKIADISIQLNQIINDSTKLNLNKRVIQLKMISTLI